ncbi:MAG TPA: DUF2939 domain-containing protein [Lysobacter sp.]|nr:DUF2939 domain-containing protein [Lysobacter sp.]
MKKLLTLCVLLAALLAGYLVAGPYIAYSAMRDAVETRDMAKLQKHVDFPVLRGNLKLQIDDYVLRRAGPDAQSSLLGAFAVRVASGMAGGVVDAMVTPAGLAALLEGRTTWHRIGGDTGDDPYTPTPPANPLREPSYRFQSPSRFTATVHGEDGEPVQFVLTRDGLRWKLTDIRLPSTPPTTR